jgi:predicted amidohydrolase YtcJ
MTAMVSRRSFITQLSGASAAFALGGCAMNPQPSTSATGASLILTNGRIATLDRQRPSASSAAIRDGRFLAVGADADVMVHRSQTSRVIDLRGRVVIPGLNDSHLHVIRGGLNYMMELRWDGVPSLAEAMRMLREQARRTPPPQWVRVVGGFTEWQFSERRLPTLAELNEVAPDTPVFVLHLYDRALLNRAAVRAVGYTKDTPEPTGGQIERDKAGNPTGLLIARPNASILYSTLARGPKLSREHQLVSTRYFMRELNRLGVTSAIDAGGGFQNFPADYDVVNELHRANLLTMRIAYNLFTQRPHRELEDFSAWVKMTRPGDGDDFFRANGAGEMLVFSASDFEDFREPKPEMAPTMEAELERVVGLLAKHRWPFRLHATYDETIGRALSAFERVNAEAPLAGLHWFIDHAETISRRNIDRVRALGGGIAIQHRMAYQGEYFVERYGKTAATTAPPIRAMLEAGVPVGAGTDATRVASYNPFVALYWLTAGKTVGGTALYDGSNRLSREEALRLLTIGSSWFSSEEGTKGAITPGQLADLAVLSADYFAIPEEDIKRLESVLTIVGGRLVHASDDFAALAPPLPPAAPDWSPVPRFGGYSRGGSASIEPGATAAAGHRKSGASSARVTPAWGSACGCWA